MKFSIKDFLSKMRLNPHTFTEEILNEKVNFLCSGNGEIKTCFKNANKVIVIDRVTSFKNSQFAKMVIYQTINIPVTE